MLRKTTGIVALALAASLVLTSCSAGAAPAAEDDAKPAETATPTPEPTFAAGDVVDAAQAEAINADMSDTTVAYPVGDSFVVVSWGKPIAPAVREAVSANVRSAAPEWGTSTDYKVSDARWEAVRDAMQAESDKLGGITVIALSCVQSFSEKTNSFSPTWVISEPGPVGQYDSYKHAFDTAEAWTGGAQGEGKRLYVTINNLGCKQ